MIQVAVLGYGTVGSGVVEVITKNHDRMCFLKVSDDTETMDLVVHASIYARYEEILRDSKGKYIYFEGNVEKDGSCIVKVLRMKR